MKLYHEAYAKRFERDHNARVWLAWHIAALQRAKKMPDIKKMLMSNTSKPRQSWREQMVIMSEWAARQNAWYEAKKKRLADGG